MKNRFKCKVLRIVLLIGIILMIFNGICLNTVISNAEELKLVTSDGLNDIQLCCDTPEQIALRNIQLILTILAFLMFFISIFKFIKKDKKKGILFIGIGIGLYLISGFLGVFRCA